MKCEYCGAEFVPDGRGTKKYCSNACCKSADRDRKRINYVGKREKVCIQCGKELPKFKTKYCSHRCELIYKGAIQDHGELTKICPVCGKEFKTFKSQKITCSTDCSQVRLKNQRNKRAREKYQETHPNARSMDEVLTTSKERKEKKRLEAMEKKAKRDSDLQKAKAKRQKEKQKRIDYWQNYCQLHECAACGEMFVAHYPTSKYCSNKCKRSQYRIKDRYEGITIDKGITLKKVSRKYKDICQLCGKVVDWNDYEEKDGVIVCGNYYPSIDHIKPIAKNGLHSWDNVQLAHRICNTIKSNN